MIRRRAEIIMERLDQLAEISDLTDGLCREFGSRATWEANQLVMKWMRSGGLHAGVDNIGNVRGYKSRQKPQVFIMGSHLDTVIHAGKFDGPLGVLLAIDQAERLDHASFPFDLQVMGFSNEEGLRFHQCYLGSHLVSGSFNKEWLMATDRNGISLEQAIRQMGGDPESLDEDRLDNGLVAGYFEVHIEQGPVLEEFNLPVAVVSHIAAQQRYMVIIAGTAGHAGTVPMECRKDALVGAAELILDVERAARENPQMVATIGTLKVDQAASNVIPGHVSLSLDIRHRDLDLLNRTVYGLNKRSKEIEEHRRLSIYWEKVFEEKPVNCNQELAIKLGNAIERCGYQKKILHSGAGHDASVIANIAPVCMLFVRCKKGISHNPLEEVSIEDIEAAIRVCDAFLDNI
jgi:hydantoinase/carbamoylase family amidase